MNNEMKIAEQINAELSKISGFEDWGRPLLAYGVSSCDEEYVLSLIQYFHLKNNKFVFVPGRIESISDVAAHFEIVKSENKASKAIDRVLYECKEEEINVGAEQAMRCLKEYVEYLINFHQYQNHSEYVSALKEACNNLEEWKAGLINAAKTHKPEDLFKYHHESVLYSLSEKVSDLEIDFLYVISQMEKFIVTTIAHSLGFDDFEYSKFKDIL